MLRRFFTWLRDWLVWSVPEDVSADMPRNLEEYRRRRAEIERRAS